MQSSTLYDSYIYPTIFRPVQCTASIFIHIQSCTIYNSYIRPYSVPIFIQPYSVLHTVQFLYSTIFRPVHCTVPIFIQPYSVLYTLQFQYSSTHIQFCRLYSSNIHPTIFSPVYCIVYSSYIHRSIFTSVHRIVSIFIKLS